MISTVDEFLAEIAPPAIGRQGNKGECATVCQGLQTLPDGLKLEDT